MSTVAGRRSKAATSEVGFKTLGRTGSGVHLTCPSLRDAETGEGVSKGVRLPACVGVYSV